MRPERDDGQKPFKASAYSEQARDRAVRAQQQAEDIAQRSNRRETRALAAQTRLEQLRNHHDERELAKSRRTYAPPRRSIPVQQSPTHEDEQMGLPPLPPPP